MRTLGILLVLSFALSAQNINSVGGSSSWGRVFNIARDAQGNFYAADGDTHNVYKIDPAGSITTFAGTGRAGFSGDGGPASSAALRNPYGIAICPDGNAYITDYGNDRIRKVDANGVITTIAGGTGGFTGDGGPASAARLNGPFSIVCDASGNLIFTDFINYRIRRITPAGVINTIAGTGRTSQSGDGGLAAGSDLIAGWLAVANDGTIYFTDDGGTTLNGYQRVRKISNNIVTTLAGTGVSGYSGDGGPAGAAQLRSASGVAVDRNGNVFIADARDNRVRKVSPSGVISTYAGTGTAGNTGDGGPALQARLNFPSGMVSDDAGNLYFTEVNTDRIRRVAAPPVPQLRTDSAILTSFGGKAGFSSNTYVEIYGMNLSATTRLWAGADFNGVNAPTSLDGVSVDINGKPAFIYYISPNQINVNTPEDTAVGPVQVQVRTPFGPSNTITVNRARLSPTLQTVPQFLINGKQHVVALTPDFSTYIGHIGMIPGVAFRPAKPGDTISIYALGCGPTTPPTQAGVVAAQGSSLMLPYTLQIGGATAQVSFAGIVGATIGLYQFNVVVPALPPGEHAITLTIDGVPNNQNLTIVTGQ
jgi:uncharacterized protein (TIGR03437 family)